MRLIKAAVLVAVITGVSSGNVIGEPVFYTGNQLLNSCRAADGEYKDAICLGYVAAIHDALAFDPIFNWRMCSPGGVTLGQAQDIVKAWLESHPQDRHYSASSLVAEALQDAFPCKE